MDTDSPFIEEGYILYNITLRPIEDEQRVKRRGTASRLDACFPAGGNATNTVIPNMSM